MIVMGRLEVVITFTYCACMGIIQEILDTVLNREHNMYEIRLIQVYGIKFPNKLIFTYFYRSYNTIFR